MDACNNTLKLRRNNRVIILLIGIVLFFYIMVYNDSIFLSRKCLPVSQQEAHIIIGNTSQQIAQTQRPATQQTPKNSSTILDHHSSNSNSSTKRISRVPDAKSEEWYLAAIKKLPVKRVTPSTLLLEQPYFQPDPKVRFELADNEIIRPSRCSDKIQVVFQILSTPETMVLRNAIRKTWGSVATTRHWPWASFEMDVRLLFVVGSRESSESNQALKDEAAVNDDILQLDTEDSYSNLTRKMILGFKWINKNCPKIKYVIKTDQDIFPNIPLIWQFLVHHGKNNSIYGHAYFKASVKRSGKWAVSVSALPINDFPAYTSGTSYVLSVDAVAKVLQTYYLFPYVCIEDAFITGIVASVAKIDRYNLRGFTEWNAETPDSCEFIKGRMYTGTGLTIDSFRSMWSDIKDGDTDRCI